MLVSHTHQQWNLKVWELEVTVESSYLHQPPDTGHFSMVSQIIPLPELLQNAIRGCSPRSHALVVNNTVTSIWMAPYIQAVTHVDLSGSLHNLLPACYCSINNNEICWPLLWQAGRWLSLDSSQLHAWKGLWRMNKSSPCRGRRKMKYKCPGVSLILVIKLKWWS